MLTHKAYEVFIYIYTCFTYSLFRADIEYFILTSQHHMIVPQLDFEPIIEPHCVAFVCSSSAIHSSYQVVVQSRESVM